MHKIQNHLIYREWKECAYQCAPQLTTMSSRVSKVASYMQDSWAASGVEVAATGANTVTLRLPPNLEELSELCMELYEEFGVTVSLKHVHEPNGAQLTIWVPTSSPELITTNKPFRTIVPERTTCSGCIKPFLAICIGVVVANIFSWKPVLDAYNTMQNANLSSPH